MKGIIVLLLAFTFSIQLNAQTIEELYTAKDYQGLTWLEGKSNKTLLTGEQSYMFANAFFQTENDLKAVEYFNQAIAKGFDSSFVYFQKAVSLKYLKKYAEAHQTIDIVIEKDKGNIKYLTEKGLIYLAQKQYKQAQEIFNNLKKISTDHPEAYYWSAYTYLQSNQPQKALDEFYITKSKTKSGDRYYLLTLNNIGELEYKFRKDYSKSIKVYLEAAEESPTNYELKFSLIKSYNALGDTAKADSLFKLVQKAYANAELSREHMKAQNIVIADFEWKGQPLVLRKSLFAPKNKQDIAFKIFLLDKKEEVIERKFEVHQTSDSASIPRFQLYEEDPSGKETLLPYTWNTQNISATNLRKHMEMVLNQKKKL